MITPAPLSFEGVSDNYFIPFRQNRNVTYAVFALDSVRASIVCLFSPIDSVFWCLRDYNSARNLAKSDSFIAGKIGRATLRELRAIGLNVKTTLLSVIVPSLGSHPRYKPKSLNLKAHRRVLSQLVSVEDVEQVIQYYSDQIQVFGTDSLLSVADDLVIYPFCDSNGNFRSESIQMFQHAQSPDPGVRLNVYRQSLKQLNDAFDGNDGDEVMKAIDPAIGSLGSCSLNVIARDADAGALELAARSVVAKRVDIICEMKLPTFYDCVRYQIDHGFLYPGQIDRLNKYLNNCKGHELCASDPLSESRFIRSIYDAWESSR